MFNDLQILLLQKEKARDLAREWRNDDLLHEAKRTHTSASTRDREQARKQALLRTLTLVLLIMLLTFGLTRIARAQSPLLLTKCPQRYGDRAELLAAIALANSDDDHYQAA